MVLLILGFSIVIKLLIWPFCNNLDTHRIFGHYCLAPRDFGNFTTTCCVSPLKFEDLRPYALVFGTPCFKFPTHALRRVVEFFEVSMVHFLSKKMIPQVFSNFDHLGKITQSLHCTTSTSTTVCQGIHHYIKVFILNQERNPFEFFSSQYQFDI